jgi:hypothetical protein
MMAFASPHDFALRAGRGPARFLLRALSTVIRACIGSILGMSTVLTFVVFGLVVFAGMPLDKAVTITAIGVNAMVFCMLLLGSLASDTDG